MENELDLGFDDEEVEVVENKDNEELDYFENENGESYDKEELAEWSDLVRSAENLINNGELDPNEAPRVLQGVYKNYIQKRDLEEAVNQGIKPEDITKEAWEMYENNIGKLSIKQAMDKTDTFLKEFMKDIEVKNTRKVKRRSDPFLDGFNSY